MEGHPRASLELPSTPALLLEIGLGKMLLAQRVAPFVWEPSTKGSLFAFGGLCFAFPNPNLCGPLPGPEGGGSEG